jgi:hypothetical protein
MENSNEHRGVTGNVEIIFAIPTDNPRTWRMKNGRLAFANGATVGIDIEGGYIPYFKGSHGLTVTYCIFKDIRHEGNRVIGDVAMMTCINGRVIEANDIADGVEVMPTAKIAAALASKTDTAPDQL